MEESQKSQPDMGTITKAEWYKLLNSIKKKNWRTSLEEISATGLNRRKRWFTSTSKALFYKNLKLKNKERFLDIGAGSGVISAELGKQFKTGISLDFSENTTQFMKERFRQDNIKNIRIVRGDGLLLPFNSNAFNLVIVNGVLEWIADRPDKRKCIVIQRVFLKEIRRCLSGNGKIAIAIENRWSLGFLFGQSPHGEPPFVALLPRLLARFITRIVQKKDYKNYIYTYFGYKRLLKRAGYKRIKIYIAIPNYYNPHYIGRISDKKISALIMETKGQKKGKRVIIQKILDKLGLLPLFCHSYYITASKQ